LANPAPTVSTPVPVMPPPSAATAPAEFGATRLFEAGAAAAAPAPATERLSGTRMFEAVPAAAASAEPRPAPGYEPEAAPVAAAAPQKKFPVALIGIAAAAIVVIGIVVYIALRPGKPTGTTAATQSAESTPAATTNTPATPNPVAPPPAVAPAELGTVTVESNQPGDVFVDGQKQGSVSGKIKLALPAGKHTLVVSALNFQAAPKTVEVRKGKDVAARFVLSEVKVVEANPYIAISGTPGATVAVDGAPKSVLDSGGNYRFQVEPGSHRVEVTLNGYRPYSTTISAKARETKSIDAHLAALPKPAVNSFNAGDPNIQQGKSTQLHWQAQNATEVDIQPGFPHQGASGSITISPASTTTYHITARGEGGTAEGPSVTVNVSAPAAAAPKPAIAVFKAVPDHVPAGQGTTLAWVVQNADSLSIDQGVGPVSGDSHDIKPARSTTYTLTATGPGGSITKAVTVTVDAAVAQQPEAPQKSPDLQAMEDIVGRYKAANEHLSPDELQAVMPVSKERRQSILDIAKEYSAVTYTISNCEVPSINGDAAQYVCRQSVMYTDRKGKRVSGGNGTVVFSFRRAGGNWALQDVRGK
ncbi:MAG TPA: PEGA domain-containing protein, partial [Terriglobales bacterium]|nr:PEGA domain-containing protein [Terriglobales bacterium]